MVYLVLGAAGSGRREVLADLIEGGLGESDRPAVFLSDNEAPDMPDGRFGRAERWRMSPSGGMELQLLPDSTHIFIVSDGTRSQVDQVEAFKAWIDSSRCVLARVLTVVDCRMIEKNPAVFAWFEACIHFSDFVLLNRREGVPNKWVSDFRANFESRFYPCIFELVKDGRVSNPAMVLAPVARRMSHVFDEIDWVMAGGSDDDDEEEEGEVEMQPEVDPYFERRMGGRRIKELPDIRDFLTPQ